MKTDVRRLGIAVLAAASLWGGQAAAQDVSAVLEEMEPVQLTFGHFVAPNSTLGETYAEYARMIEERTNGKVTIQFFWSNSLFSMTEALQAVAGGIADLGIVNAGYFPSELPLMTPFEHAFNASDLWVGQRASSRLQRESAALRQAFERNGIVWVAPYTSGTFQSFIHDGSTWSSVKDFEGRTVRSMGGARADWYSALGAEPVFMPVTDVYEAAERGVVWGFENTLSLAADLKQNEVVNTVLDIDSGVVMSSATVMNLDRWNSLPEEVQEIIVETGVEWGEMVQARAIIEREQAIQEEWEALGVTFRRPEPDQLRTMRELGLDQARKMAQDVDSRLGSTDTVATLEMLWQYVGEAEKELEANGYPWQ